MHVDLGAVGFWSWLGFLILLFLVSMFIDKTKLTDARRICAAIAIAWLGSNITALVIFLASRP